MTSSSRIVIISSVAGIIPVPYRTVYCASKHALTGFANSLRLELKDKHGDDDSPKVLLINLQGVSGTSLNTGRMEFGADLPPMEFTTGPYVAGVEETCELLMKQIATGKSEWGQPWKVMILLPLRGMMMNVVDAIILKIAKKMHYRPAFRPSVAN
eukprot:762_1